MEKKNNSTRGGARPNSGRPRKDRTLWKQITCVLRADTIEKIKAGAGGGNARFSQFLQDHLDEHPLPSREAYLSLQRLKANKTQYSNSAWDREVRRIRRQERERQRLERSLAGLSKKERARLAWASKQFPGPEKAKAKVA